MGFSFSDVLPLLAAIPALIFGALFVGGLYFVAQDLISRNLK